MLGLWFLFTSLSSSLLVTSLCDRFEDLRWCLNFQNHLQVFFQIENIRILLLVLESWCSVVGTLKLVHSLWCSKVGAQILVL